MKKYIQELVVVEGKSDEAKIKKYFHCRVLTTHGFYVSRQVISAIRKAQKTVGVILLLDPDYAGRNIRDYIARQVPGCLHAYLHPNQARQGAKVGVEHARERALVQALSQVLTDTPPQITITWEAYLCLPIYQNRRLRAYLSQKLSLPLVNNKRFFQLINSLQLTVEELQTLINSYES